MKLIENFDRTGNKVQPKSEKYNLNFLPLLLDLTLLGIVAGYVTINYLENTSKKVYQKTVENQLAVATIMADSQDTIVSPDTRKYIQNAYFGDDVVKPFSSCGLTFIEDEIVDHDNDPSTPLHSIITGLAAKHCIHDTDKIAFIVYDNQPIVGNIIKTEPVNNAVGDYAIKTTIEFADNADTLATLIDRSKFAKLGPDDVGTFLEGCSYPQEMDDVYCFKVKYLGNRFGYYLIEKPGTHGESATVLRKDGNIVCVLSRPVNRYQVDSDTLCSPVIE